MKRIFIIAGEPSGDLLGARVMAALKARSPDTAFSGVGGPAMAAEGLKSLFPMSELAVMGLAEVAPRLPNLIARITETAAAAERTSLDALITIDAPDFCFRVAKRVKTGRPEVPIVHMVAPSVWAWRPGRAKKIARFLDHVLCLLPFEPPYFEREGLAATFIGHPAVESGAAAADGAAFRARAHVPEGRPLLAVLPGSRGGEMVRHVPVFRKAVEQMQQSAPRLICVTAAPEHLAAGARRAMADWPVDLIFAENEADKFSAFAAADAALAASGTVSLELALAGCPAVIAYRMNPLTAAAAMRLTNVEHVSLINLAAGRRIMPEFIQRECRAQALTGAVSRLLTDPSARAEQKDAFGPALAALGLGGEPPAARAAAVIEDCMRRA
ncbi:MAG: lipid-A-disaccharide synthase [Rhodospirillales bacterium]